MSGVSITSGAGVDIDAILQGGQAFVDRMADFKASRDGFEKALADLQLGKDARSALDEAARIRDEAKVERDVEMDKLLKHVAGIKADTSDWASATRGAAMQARDEAEKMRADAEKMQATAKSVLADANARAAEIDGRIEATKKQFRDAQAALMQKVDTL